jgi:hypothetical protein
MIELSTTRQESNQSLVITEILERSPNSSLKPSSTRVLAFRRISPIQTILESHARYPSIKDAVKLAKMQYAKFDEYDKSNDNKNIKKLDASLSDDLL